MPPRWALDEATRDEVFWMMALNHAEHDEREDAKGDALMKSMLKAQARQEAAERAAAERG